MFPVLPAPRAATPGPPSWGLQPSLFATSTGSKSRAGFPIPAQIRPRRFSRPRRFASLPASWVCFTPQPRPGFSPSGVLSLAKPVRLVAASCPHVVGSAPLPPVARKRHVTAPRPQGFTPCEDPLLPRRCLVVAGARSPRGVPPPPGFRSPLRETAFTASTALDLATGSVESYPAAAFSVSVAAPGLPLSRAADLLEYGQALLMILPWIFQGSLKRTGSPT